jgi:1-pyrroline-5-carboxylate dehydrogenase
VAHGGRKYRQLPTGGKDFIVAHPSADVDELTTAMVRGAFEFQGQKCSAASRCYIPKSLWPATKEKLVAQVKGLKMGSPEDHTNFVNAVIDEAAFTSITSYIDYAKTCDGCEIIVGGNYDKSKGYFIEPTVVTCTDPHCKLIEEEIFGPVLTVYVYEDEEFAKTLHLVDTTSPYRCRRGTAAVRRWTCFGNQRQSRRHSEHAEVDIPPIHQGNLRSAKGLSLSVYGIVPRG